MKSKISVGFSLLPFVLLLCICCLQQGRSSFTDEEDQPKKKLLNASTLLIRPNATICPNAPNYGDSILYPQPKNGGDFFADPINNTGVQGAIPELARRADK